MNHRASELINLLDLRPHPEGGFFCERFRSSRLVSITDGQGRRSALTTIYFLLISDQWSRWHQVRQDEIWHYYEGDPLELFRIEQEGNRSNRSLIGEVNESTKPVSVVPGGCWQAARTTGEYTLVGCTVGPGFEFEDFQLLQDCPEVLKKIKRRFPELMTFL